MRANGVGPIVRQPSTLHGSDLNWAMIVGLMSCISNMATLVTYAASLEHIHSSWGAFLTLFWCRSNAPDFASRAKRPFAAGLPQLLAVPFTFSIVSFIGIIVSSSSQVIFGEPVWSPVDLLDRFLDDHPSHATRFGVCSSIRSEVRSRGSRGANRCGSYRPRSSSHRYVTFPCPANSVVYPLR